MPLIELSTALVAAGSSVVVPFVNKVLEKTASRVGDNFDANLVALFTKAHEYLTVTGREPQPVEPKLLLPLVQAASIETDAALAAHWAALLANAADPAQKVQVQPGFAEVLRQLTPVDAKILTCLYLQTSIDFFAVAYSLNLLRTAGFEKLLSITRKELVISIDNLLRLRLCSQSSGSTIKMSDPDKQMLVSDSVYPTAFGLSFLTAVSPPVL